MKSGFKILILLILPIIYLILREQIVSKWNDIESAIAILGYITSLFFYSYNTDIKVHFFILRIVNYFRFDHTTWRVSYRAETEKDEIAIINDLAEKLKHFSVVFKRRSLDSLEVLLENNYLLNISFSKHNGVLSAFAFTSDITVPIKQSKVKSNSLTKLLETLEETIQPISNKQKEYSIDVEYRTRSPYYSYWIKKLPEEMIHNFNCSISIPNNQESKIKVNKNHVIISSNSLSNLFSITNDYINLQPL